MSEKKADVSLFFWSDSPTDEEIADGALRQLQSEKSGLALNKFPDERCAAQWFSARCPAAFGR